MMFLEKVSSLKRDYISKRREYYDSCLKEALPLGDPNSFSRALSCPGASIITEIKKASPSAGRITSLSAPELARIYSKASADAVSVLREEEYFNGSIEDVRSASEIFKGPVLLKDFLIDKAQIAEALMGGASAVLLIAALLNDKELIELLRFSKEYSMDALVEVHTIEEALRASDAGAGIIGVNSRDLRTLSVEPEVHFRIAEYIPKDIIKVAESGISTREEILKLSAAGYSAFLIGSSIIASSDPEKKIRELKGL